MPTVVDTSALDRLRARFERIVSVDPADLMLTWGNFVDDDNRKGILAGLDGNGNPLTPVTYRPKKPGVKLTVAQRLGQKPRTKRGRYAAFGSIEEGLNNNLSSTSYAKLDGPPLAPRRQFSRSITNFKTRWGQISHRVFQLVGYWDNVISKKGVPFLKFHFDGEGRLPRRDLRGIRPEGVEKCRKAARAWMISEVRNAGA